MRFLDRRYFYLALGIIFSLLLIFLSVTIASQRSSFSGRASGPSSGALLSLENSYLFASPISAPADGSSLIRVTIFLLNSQGLGIAGQKVALKTSKAVNMSLTQPITDTFGRAMFDVSASVPGNYTISAEVGGTTLPQTVSISFQ